MSKGNPRKAVAAILPAPIGEVRPMTLAMYAALERIKSPLVTGEEPKDAAELLPSLYLLTHGAAEIFRGNLVALAFEWADTVPVSAMREIREACERQMKTVMDVMPEAQKKRPRERRLDRDRRPPRRKVLWLELPRNPLGSPALRADAPPPPGKPRQHHAPLRD